METITQQHAVSLIEKSGGKFFTVVFTKRSTKTARRMTGRKGVRKGVTGQGQAFNPADHGLITVFETVTERDEKGHVRTKGTQWRNVSMEGITALRIGGKRYNVIPSNAGFWVK